MNIAGKMRRLREEFNLTQTQAALGIGVKQSYLSRWERGKTTPSVKSLKKISQFYRVPISSLMEVD